MKELVKYLMWHVLQQREVILLDSNEITLHIAIPNKIMDKMILASILQ